jgi:hypothetical protein
MKQPTKLELVVNAWSLTGVNIRRRRPSTVLSSLRVPRVGRLLVFFRSVSSARMTNPHEQAITA